MHMHVYPYAGQGRRLTMDVLKLLYPEVEEYRQKFIIDFWRYSL